MSNETRTTPNANTNTSTRNRIQSSFNLNRSTIYKRNQKRVAKLRARPKDHRIAPVRILANLPSPIGPIFALNHSHNDDNGNKNPDAIHQQVEKANLSSQFERVSASIFDEHATIIDGLSSGSTYYNATTTSHDHHYDNHQQQNNSRNKDASAKVFLQAAIGGGFGGALESFLNRAKQDFWNKSLDRVSSLGVRASAGGAQVNHNAPNAGAPLNRFNFFEAATAPVSVNVGSGKSVAATGGSGFKARLEHNSFLLSNVNAAADIANAQSHRMLTSVMSAGILFGSNAYIRKLVGVDNNAPISGTFVLSSMLTGVATASVFTPFELIRSRLFIVCSSGSSMSMQPRRMPNSSANVGSIVGAYLAEGYQVVKQDGVRALYRGGSHTFLREIIGNTMYFSTYRIAKSYLEHNQDGSSSTISKVVHLRNVALSGALAGASYWSFVYPIDTLRAMAQQQVRSVGAMGGVPSSSAIGHMSVQCLYRGYLSCVMRAMPANAALFIGYEFVMNSLS